MELQEAIGFLIAAGIVVFLNWPIKYKD